MKARTKPRQLPYLVLLALLPFSLSGASSSGDSKKSVEAKSIFERATDAQRNSELEISRELFNELVTKHSDTPLTKDDADDVNAHGPTNVRTYGDFANHFLPFVEAELREGKKRTFADLKKLTTDLFSAIRSGNQDEIEKYAWVEMLVGPCGSHVARHGPAEATRELVRRLKGRSNQIKKVSKDGSRSLKISLGPGEDLELSFLKRGSGWIWSWLVYCAPLTEP